MGSQGLSVALPWAQALGALERGGHMENRIEIKYCTQCRWLMRSAWMAQELLTTFDQEISELSLRPGTGGIFEVVANGVVVWSRKVERSALITSGYARRYMQ